MSARASRPLTRCDAGCGAPVAVPADASERQTCSLCAFRGRDRSQLGIHKMRGGEIVNRALILQQFDALDAFDEAP